MRIPEYLSYSALTLWEKNREEYYLKYLADNRPERIPQTPPAAIGSAFDAYVKTALSDNLGIQCDFEALFEAQVEPPNRAWALEEGRYVLACYKDSGLYRDLLNLMGASTTQPRFEYTVRATLGGVPFLGKPDASWTVGDAVIIHDWKINGYCSNSATSPHKGYRLCKDCFSDKPSKSNGQAHKNYVETHWHGIPVDSAYLEGYHPGWADQLSLYGWTEGADVGSENTIFSIHQGVAKPSTPRPTMRFADYRARVSEAHQLALACRLTACWNSIVTGHIFTDLPLEESQQRCTALEAAAAALVTDGSEEERAFSLATRAPYRG